MEVLFESEDEYLEYITKDLARDDFKRSAWYQQWLSSRLEMPTKLTLDDTGYKAKQERKDYFVERLPHGMV